MIIESVKFSADEFLRSQGIYDECEFCHVRFWWLISCGIPVCPNCLYQLSRNYDDIIKLMKKTREMTSSI
jgi:hypothetical protein